VNEPERRTERARSTFAIYISSRGYYVSGELGQGQPGTLKTSSWIVESAAFDSYERAAQELARLGFTDCTHAEPTLNNAYVCHRSM